MPRSAVLLSVMGSNVQGWVRRSSLSWTALSSHQANLTSPTRANLEHLVMLRIANYQVSLGTRLLYAQLRTTVECATVKVSIGSRIASRSWDDTASASGLPTRCTGAWDRHQGERGGRATESMSLSLHICNVVPRFNGSHRLVTRIMAVQR